MGLKKFLFGDENACETAQAVVKNKKLSLLEKYLQIKNLYINYFKYYVDRDAKNALYELHYEEIYKKGVFQPNAYQYLLNLEKENLLFYNSFMLCKQFDQLAEQGLDVKLLKSSKEDFANDVLNLKKECKFGKNFDGTQFYSDNTTRQFVLKKIEKFVENITTSKTSNEEQTL